MSTGGINTASSRPARYPQPEKLKNRGALQKMVLAAAGLCQRVLDLELETVPVLAKPLTIGLAAAHPPSFYLEEDIAQCLLRLPTAQENSLR